MFSEEQEKEELGNLPTGQLSPQVFLKFQLLIMQLLETVDIHFQDGERTIRKTIEYGYGFQKMVNKDFSYEDPPQLLIDLGNEVCDTLDEPRESFSNYIISVYDPGFQIEPHYDTDLHHLKEYGFYFDEKVFGVIIKPDPTGGLYFAHYNGNDIHPPLDLKPRFPVIEKPGTVFVLKGKYRYKPYYHGVSEISKLRISVTFR